MSKPLESWTVLPHQRLATIDDGILTAVGKIKMPLVEFERRMTVVRLRGGRTAIWSAIALDDDEMAEIEKMGTPSYLVVPLDRHRLDVKIYKQRYPSIKVVAPEGARAKVEELVPVDTTTPDFDDPNVTFSVVPGTKGHEAAMVVRRDNGTTLILNEIVANIRHEHGFGGWLLRLMGFSGDDAPSIPVPVKLGMMEDKATLRRQLLAWSEIENLRRVIVSHGEPLEGDPKQSLIGLARSLE